MASEWPPSTGELWFTMERWPETGTDPEVPGGSWVTILKGQAMGHEGGCWGVGIWWKGEVLGPNGVTFIKAVKGDLIPGDDPRICAPAA
jgi:hypothetical protein